MQESNEVLVQRIRDGERELLPQLWEQVQAFVRSEAARWLRAWQKSRPMLEFDDLYQCGYIALCEAVETHQAESGAKFITWLGYHLKTAFSREVGCRTARQVREGNALTLSLDAPLGGDTEDITLGDMVPDPVDGYSQAETNIYHAQLHTVVQNALDELPQPQREAIKLRYFDGLTLKEVSRGLGIEPETVRQREQKGLRALRKGNTAADLREAYYGDRNYYRGTGYHAWLHHGCSSPEWELIQQEERACNARF